MVVDPVVLAEPGVLHRDDQVTVWHSGVVLGPPGVIALRMDVEWVPLRQQWQPAGELEVFSENAPALYFSIEGQDRLPMGGGDFGHHGGDHHMTGYARILGSIRGRRAQPPLTVEQVHGATLVVDAAVLKRRFRISLRADVS